MNLSAIIYRLPKFFRRRKLVTLLLAVFPGSNIQKVEMDNGGKLYADVSDLFPKTYFVTRGFDPEFFETASFFLSGGGVFFDVGAHFGFCSFGIMGRLAGAGVRYHLFEANEDVARVLEKSRSLWPENAIEIRHACVTDRPGTSKLFVKKGHLSGSYISGDGTQSVPNLTLDDYISQQAIKRVDFLKIDVEGHEYAALQGASRSLENGVIRAVFMEASEPNMKNQPWKVSNCLDFLRQKKFKIYYVRKSDFPAQLEPGEVPLKLRAKGASLEVVPLKTFPAGHQTDLLALPESSEFLST